MLLLLLIAAGQLVWCFGLDGGVDTGVGSDVCTDILAKSQQALPRPEDAAEGVAGNGGRDTRASGSNIGNASAKVYLTSAIGCPGDL